MFFLSGLDLGDVVETVLFGEVANLREGLVVELMTTSLRPLRDRPDQPQARYAVNRGSAKAATETPATTRAPPAMVVGSGPRTVDP